MSYAKLTEPYNELTFLIDCGNSSGGLTSFKFATKYFVGILKVVEFKEVLLINNDKDMELGSPLIEGAKVEGKIVKQTKNKTVLIFKKRRRHNSRRKNGHRQKISVIQITKIFGKGGKLLSEAKKKTEQKKDKTTTKKSA